MAEWVWVLEAFDRGSGRFCSRHRLAGLTDAEARSLVGLADLGEGDLFDVPEVSLAELATRFRLKTLPEKFQYMLGRESS